MRAVVIREYGGPEVLAVEDVPAPEPRPGEVLIDVAAAGVNRPDIQQRLGYYPPPPGASPLPGLEVSGVVTALGADISSSHGIAVGDEVCALLAGGGYADTVAVPVEQVLPRPDGVSLVDAAGLPETVCTVWSNVVLLAHLQPGETLLVHGGASGIGTTAIQIGKALDARVIVTVGGAAKAERCLALGADAAIRYREEDFVERVGELTDGHGADVVLDIVGAAYLARNVECLATNGRLVVIGLQKGRRAELDLGALLTKRAAVLATTLRGRPLTEKAAIVRTVRDYAWPLVAEGRLRPVVDRTFPLEEAAEAHRYLESSAHVGKVLLTL
ncbi:MAG TPA: NAD(P)H-quinone oxidoreductase [Actinopolymorphaceae bacterium]